MEASQESLSMTLGRGEVKTEKDAVNTRRAFQNAQKSEKGGI